MINLVCLPTSIIINRKGIGLPDYTGLIYCSACINEWYSIKINNFQLTTFILYILCNTYFYLACPYILLNSLYPFNEWKSESWWLEMHAVKIWIQKKEWCIMGCLTYFWLPYIIQCQIGEVRVVWKIPDLQSGISDRLVLLQDL